MVDLKNILEQYDLNLLKINEKYNYTEIDNIIIIENENIDKHNNLKIIYKDKTEKYIEYEILGIYDKKTDIFTWSWAIPEINKKNTIIIRKLWNYISTVDINEITNIEEVKHYLLHSQISVSEYYILELCLACCMYIIKKNYIIYWNDINNPDVIIYFILLE